jgi:hypothetical protein
MTTTYLQLTNRVLQALNEVPLTSSNFDNTSDGFANEVKESINQAIFDIYTEEDIKWPFAWSETTFNTVIGTRDYTPLAGVSTINWSSFIILGDGDTISSLKLPQVDWQVYKDKYLSKDLDLDTIDYSKPQFVVRKPNNYILISPTPDQVYTISYEYYSIPSALTVATSTTTIPDEYTQLIVDKALHYAYMFRDNMELASMAQQRYETNVNKVRRILIPQFTRITLAY